MMGSALKWIEERHGLDCPSCGADRLWAQLSGVVASHSGVSVEAQAYCDCGYRERVVFDSRHSCVAFA
jgi:C4-type Zn-finger protein